ncbi:hypothetical protein BJY52DRAFT_1282599, partial [Lactarius psammicola]
MLVVRRGAQHGRILALCPLFLPFLCSKAYPQWPSYSRNPVLANDSFIQSYTDNGSIIITAKPVEHPQVIDKGFEDQLHVIVACSIALLLVTLLGLFIRHYGLTLPQLQHTPSTDTEDQTPIRGKEAVFGLGFSQLESPASVRVPPAARV